jgi:hypothetical protein
MAGQIDELTVLRAAILMFADSMLSDLRTIRHAKTIEEAQTPINGMIDRVNALADAAVPARVEKDLLG